MVNTLEVAAKIQGMIAELVGQAEGNKQGLEIEQHADILDRAVNESNRMGAAAMAERDRGLIADLQMALERIREGGYGVCDRCDDPISPRRLELVPWATLCRDCKEHEERVTKDRLAPPVRKLIDHKTEQENGANDTWV